MTLADLAGGGVGLIHVARDDARMAAMAEALGFFRPDLTVRTFPAWDCLPYDRISPNGDIVSQRIDLLSDLAAATGRQSFVLVTTVNAILQRVPARQSFAKARFAAAKGERLVLEELMGFLGANGYRRAETVREPGEYAVRGGIVDLFPPGSKTPLRLDLFGDMLEGIRAFDPMTQRSADRLERFVLKPVSEVPLSQEAIARFRAGYRELFGAGDDDPLYEGVSNGLRPAGVEHWLPLFHERLETLFSYVPNAGVTFDHQIEEAAAARFEQINEYYDARMAQLRQRNSGEAAPYNPLPADRLYLAPADWEDALAARAVGIFSPFDVVEGARGIDAGARPALDFAGPRKQSGVALFDAVAARIGEERAAGRQVVIAAYSAGSRERLMGLMADHGIAGLQLADTWVDALAARETVNLVVLGLERGFTAPGLAMLTEQDILGDRLIRAAKRRVRPENFLTEASTLTEGDLVVHADHGIGRFDGLVTIDVAGAAHDCLRLIYAGNDKLFVPVENIDVLSRYGSEDAGAELDKLGGAAWQARKARVKKRIGEMAAGLIRLAAARTVTDGDRMAPAHGLYEEFCARFPYAETEDQARAIDDTIADLASGRPMDRLVCGDVGFGKTEVALRAAFVAATSGSQVAVVVPTTLLARQHFRNFRARFEGLPVRVEQLSRLVGTGSAREIKKDLAEGRVDVVVGTSALLASSIAFKDLGLIIVDEEQHFGVKQKERLKEFKAKVHVLTLTATPIPRTLQLALAGVRDMSIIASPPVDRLAIRTFVLPYDPVVIREAIMRERFRGGQTFYVCPRIEDIAQLHERLGKIVPECKIAVAHGRLSPTETEAVMTGFVDGSYDILLATNIIESGLDIPAVNTIIVHRADLFGLAQLYQLRGRVGRAKVRAYAYLTVPADRVLAPTAQRRLEVMQTLDSLGAGFQLASHDLDIRGAGNLLGEEQSGHIREVGIELYQQMLEDAVAAAREEGQRAAAASDEWTPQIKMGVPVLIPESYVEDLGVRLGLYRRLGALVERAEIDSFAAELIDRFGTLPDEVKNLLEVIAIKQQCRRAGVDRIDAGPKGAVIGFRENKVAKPDRLIGYIQREPGVKLRPDQRLVYMRPWDDPRERAAGLHRILDDLAKLAG
ncbi:MAG: transcription-repair coupling factor [Alphaproteobacteria bacterium]|nr:transcription-repair coupling factor [Alphaproteobacteria bacterium]